MNRDMGQNKLDVTYPLIIGVDLYPMEKLGGCRSEDGRAARGQMVPLTECEIVEGKVIATVAERGFEAWRFHAIHPKWGKVSFSSLDVTYVESYRHISADGPLPRDALKERGQDTYRAVAVHVDAKPTQQIAAKDLRSALRKVRPGDALLVDFGNYTDRCLEQGNGVIDFHSYNVDSPFFSEQAMKAVIDSDVSLIAGNVPSYSDPEGGSGVAMLKLYWQSPKNLILAPLLRLAEIKTDVVTLALNPVRMSYPTCGLPCCPTVEWP